MYQPAHPRSEVEDPAALLAEPRADPNQADLMVLKELAESGKLRPVIDRTFALDDTVDALRHSATGHARGKVVLSMRAA